MDVAGFVRDAGRNSEQAAISLASMKNLFCDVYFNLERDFHLEKALRPHY